MNCVFLYVFFNIYTKLNFTQNITYDTLALSRRSHWHGWNWRKPILHRMKKTKHAQNFLQVHYVKGTNGRQKTYEIFHVYCIHYSGFMCQTTVIFVLTKDRSLVLNTLASWNCFTCRNLFKNGANGMSEC